MKLHYMGKYDLNPESIPARPHKPNCVKFKEPEDSKQLSIVASIISIVLLVAFAIPVIFKGRLDTVEAFAISLIFVLAAMFPHEILHAICFKEEVYLYTNFKQGLLFVVGPEDMSKGRFIFMSMLPNIVFGIIPYLVFLLNPDLLVWGAVGALNLCAGAGDYLNVFNAITQMPKGARTYLHHFTSFWYMPEK